MKPVLLRKIALAGMLPLALGQCTRTEHARISRARLAGPLEGGSVAVEFDVQWSHSFRTDDNWDAAWVIVKYRTDGPWRHATLSTAPRDAEVRRDGGIAATVEPSADGRGVFLYRTDAGEGPVRWRDARVQWSYAQDGVGDGSDVAIMVVGVEMVYVPAGPFVVGDGERGEVRGHFHQTDGAEPFRVESEDAVVLGGRAPGGANSNNGYGMHESFPDDFDENTPVTLPAAFPKGHAAFFVMKYELTQGLYAAFLGSLDPAQLRSRNPANAQRHLRPGRNRYTITTHAPFVASVPDRPADNLSWMDAAAFADWAGLRPMTEWEFEKSGRGSAPATAGEFAWGTTRIHRERYALVQINTPQERIGNAGTQAGNAAYAVTSGSGEDCWSCLRGPLRAAAFRTPGATKQESGASFYGVMDLSGNLAERVVTVGHPVGRRFDGRHGDGHVGANGNAAGSEMSHWPGASGTGSSTQIIGAIGTGFRGGGWNSPEVNLRISDREFAAYPNNSRQAGHGYRFVRTAR
ncbi:MAG: SUMF1/EgtB/PvdO family nonheme iron enzyme [Gemmatimonadetes bacterium]|nr:SUMF1/EgtB/PvdO family nonheme iron enzyme [Gemmatimonadota bacterium]